MREMILSMSLGDFVQGVLGPRFFGVGFFLGETVFLDLSCLRLAGGDLAFDAGKVSALFSRGLAP